MKILMALTLLGSALYAQEPLLHIEIGGQATTMNASRIKVVCVGVQLPAEGEQVVRDMCKLFDMTGQVAATMVSQTSIPHEAEQIHRWSKDGYDFAIYVQMVDDTAALRWWLYDTAEVAMIAGTRFQRRPSIHQWAQTLASAFWLQVMGGPSSFGSEIVYVKKNSRGKKHCQDTICSLQWDTGEIKSLINRSTSVIAPAWYIMPSNDRAILFSEIKPTHVGLMMLHQGKVSSVSLPQGNEGTIVGVAQHPDHDTFVYCHSGNLWRYEKDTVREKVLYRKFADTDGPSICPTMLRNGDIIYGAGNKIKRWEKATNTVTVVGTNGYCIAPTCHEDMGIIVYSKRTQGVMQLWLYDMVRNVNQQLTHGLGDKTDPSISPCGNLVAFCHEKRAGSVICVLNIVTEEIQSLTPTNQYCAYPAWSPAVLL